MTETPETTTNQEKAPIDRVMDTVNELFEVIDTLLDVDTVHPADGGENVTPGASADTFPDAPAVTPARRLLDITGELIDIARKLADAETPGYWQEFTDDEAELVGAFDEDAISEEEAYRASFDNPDA